LKQILNEEYQGIEAEQAALASSHQRLDAMIATMNEELGDKLDLVLNAAPEQRPNLAGEAKEVLKRFVNLLNTDEVLAVIDANEFATDMIVAEPMRAKLREIAGALG
jgi:kynureninase